MSIICKPCFAFDALGAVVFCNYCRKDVPYIKEKIDEYFKEIKIYPGNSYFDLLVDNLSFEAIEALDLKTFIEIYPNYIEGNDFEQALVKGMDILDKIDFTHFWKENCLPVLEKQCNEFNSAMTESSVNSLLLDIQKLKPDEKIENINIYITYFTYPASFNLTANSYITNYNTNDQIDSKDVLIMFTHELIHRFSNERLKGIYRKTYQSDELLKKSNDVLFNKKGSPSDEEEFVVALEHAISLKNGLMTKEEAYNSIFHHYESCMPIAVIVFNELEKQTELPDDINSWIYSLFTNGTIRIGEIESDVNKILPGYVASFKNHWFKQE